MFKVYVTILKNYIVLLLKGYLMLHIHVLQDTNVKVKLLFIITQETQLKFYI